MLHLNQFIIFDYDREPTQREIEFQKTKLGFGECVCFTNSHGFEGFNSLAYDTEEMFDFLGRTIDDPIEKANNFRIWYLSKNPWMLYTDLDCHFIQKPSITEESPRKNHPSGYSALWSGSGIDLKKSLLKSKKTLTLREFKKRGFGFISHESSRRPSPAVEKDSGITIHSYLPQVDGLKVRFSKEGGRILSEKFSYENKPNWFKLMENFGKKKLREKGF